MCCHYATSAGHARQSLSLILFLFKHGQALVRMANDSWTHTYNVGIIRRVSCLYATAVGHARQSLSMILFFKHGQALIGMASDS